jgi:hypothetical protein
MDRSDAQIEVGSIWKSSNVGHPPSHYRVLSTTVNKVKVLNITRRGPRQHRAKIYMIPLENFRMHHQCVD